MILFYFNDVDCSSALLNPVALRKAKIVYNFGLSECNRVKLSVLVFFINYVPKHNNVNYLSIKGTESGYLKTVYMEGEG